MGRKINQNQPGVVVYDPTRVHLDSDRISIQAAFDLFISSRRMSGCVEKTITTYLDHVQEFINWFNSQFFTYIQGGQQPAELNRKICDVKKSHLETWEGILRRERKNSDASVQTKIKSIRTFLYWCMDEERRWISPSYKIKLPKANPDLKTPYTKEELDDLLLPPNGEDLTEWRNWACVSIVVRTGIRLSTAVNLKWSDVDWEKHTFLLRHTKTGEQYYVPIPVEAMEALHLWYEYSPQTEQDYIFFSTYTEEQISPNSLYQSVRKYNLRRGVKKTSFHLLRHTYATIYLQKGGRQERLQKILGHSTRDMTDRYVHFVLDDLREGIDDFTV